eukprot:CAMPEP_0172206262 /NCGR_PEP_ID=MMETSP1050-20130122/33110_1 /TAXON_ID=233186 /ORGANISM="Cryptomonas curvata, Strain CCAP979/52" /LENGTH=179 /DNA_ID=CAMNT_0012885305 /DNA_START=113 /DNA_END=650 /DNA_ORIENTATION=+
MCLDSPDPAKRQAYQDVALRGLVDVGQRVPQEWSEGIEFEFSEMSCFQANEIVVLKRPDGALRFGRIELTSSATLVDDDTVELGRGGNSARSIHVVEIERGLMGSRPPVSGGGDLRHRQDPAPAAAELQRLGGLRRSWPGTAADDRPGLLSSFLSLVDIDKQADVDSMPFQPLFSPLRR